MGRLGMGIPGKLGVLGRPGRLGVPGSCLAGRVPADADAAASSGRRACEKCMIAWRMNEAEKTW